MSLSQTPPFDVSLATFTTLYSTWYHQASRDWLTPTYSSYSSLLLLKETDIKLQLDYSTSASCVMDEA
ncbi:hypothetical protein BT69DRAFT_1282876 [Atractiella rhizophila]|nr:hypothetical protein BT69DRAFT_1289180 [Atractiella rhizophila]KAH8921789.1 hypothetical protein BT69DRAFT_1282876 [Atractiella rhizophila]